MVDMMNSACAWLNEQRNKFSAAMIQYRRGTNTLPLSATRGRTVFRYNDQFGRSIREERRDFLINVADLMIDGAIATPRHGDTIIDGNFTYEVIAPNKEPVWKYADAYRRSYRVHTNLIDEVES